MPLPEANPYRPPVTATPPSPIGPRRLNWAGRLILILTFVAGVALFTYVGLHCGVIVGLERGTPHLNGPPTKGVGIAPDLSDLVNAAAELGAAMFLFTLGGLLAGVIVMSALCFPLRALAMRWAPWLTTVGQASQNPSGEL
jgi:hypothetical protein